MKTGTIGRLVSEESGMTMGLAIITMVLVGVMGAGLLTFVSTDLNSVVEVNQGQKALEMADAGVRAAQRQILTDSSPATNYDGGIDDLRWSYCHPGSAPAGCTSATPTPTGSTGMRLNMGSDSVSVTILKTSAATPTYKVVAEGRVGEARRKVEAVFESGGAVSAPRAYLTRGNLTLTGSTDVQGISFFSLGNVTTAGGFTPGSQADAYFGRWAETSGAGPYPNSLGSYPNAYNSTPRSSGLAGVGAWGTISSTGSSNVYIGTQSYDRTTNPKVVSDFNADGTPGQQSTEMAFPFKVPTADEDKQTIQVLRQRALALERTFPGTPYYIDANPGDGVDGAGMPNRPAGSPLVITNWYSSSDFQTVRFYEFETYNANNIVNYASGSGLPDCSSTLPPPRGIIVAQNGDFQMNSNKAFDGAILVRAYDASGNVLPPPASATSYTNGSFNAEGSACLRGYANSSGNMRASGNISPGGIPDLASQFGSGGSMQMRSWRELYQ